MMEKWRLPEGWRTKKLGSVCTTTSGGTPSRKKPAYFQGSIPWVKSGELNDGAITATEENITEEAIKDSSAKIFPQGTLLIAMYGATVGKLGILDVDAATNQAVCAIFPPQEISRDFLFWYLLSIRTDLVDISFGGAQPNISQTVIKNIDLPIPYPDDPARSLAEQQRIVARLETALGEVREMRELQSQIEVDVGRLMDAAVQEVFDRPNPRWKTVLLSDSAFIQTGTAKGRRFGNRETVELPYLRVANVQAGHLDLREIKTLPIAADEIERYRLQPGDLLLTEGGDHDKLGRGAVWEGQIDTCIHQNHIFAVRFDPEQVIPKFAEYQMQSWYARNYFLRVAKKTTNLATINKTKLGNFPLRYPPLSEQRAIVAHLAAAEAEVGVIQQAQLKNAALVEQLEQSILAQAFRGEL
ncbi:MAG: restriction endonuclease subunit S [Anaerolineae bacterium]|nr:restriction endonuclease subunit S [Anaerolineae bacterium]